MSEYLHIPSFLLRISFVNFFPSPHNPFHLLSTYFYVFSFLQLYFLFPSSSLLAALSKKDSSCFLLPSHHPLPLSLFPLRMTYIILFPQASYWHLCFLLTATFVFSLLALSYLLIATSVLFLLAPIFFLLTIIYFVFYFSYCHFCNRHIHIFVFSSFRHLCPSYLFQTSI